jgi:hypothetical protein
MWTFFNLIRKYSHKKYTNVHTKQKLQYKLHNVIDFTNCLSITKEHESILKNDFRLISDFIKRRKKIFSLTIFSHELIVANQVMCFEELTSVAQSSN